VTKSRMETVSLRPVLRIFGRRCWRCPSWLPDRARSPRRKTARCQQRPVCCRSPPCWTAASCPTRKSGVLTWRTSFPCGPSGRLDRRLKSRCELAVGKTEFRGVYLCKERYPHRPGAGAGRATWGPAICGVRPETLSEKTELPVYLGLIPSAAEVWRRQAARRVRRAGTRRRISGPRAGGDRDAPGRGLSLRTLQARRRTSRSSTARTTTGPPWAPTTAAPPCSPPWAGETRL
jgi:hypothetical protein